MTKSGDEGGFKDLFSDKSASYLRYRPVYPQSLYPHLASLTKRRELAWDCGTGNGQAAVELASFFRQVIATDPSASQLAQAQVHPRVSYRQSTAEDSRLEENTVDLITVAQALHWFKHDLFFEEARRVASREGSVLAVWSYALCKIRPDLDRYILTYYTDTVGRFWEPERRHVDEAYRGISFPFPELELPRFEMTEQWTPEHFFGYLSTWSATKAAAKALGTDPLEELRGQLAARWPAGQTLTVAFDFTARAFKLY